MIKTKDIIKRYESFFTKEQLERFDVQDKICIWANRDISFAYDQIQKDATMASICGKRRVIRDYVGSARNLLKILKVSEEIK